MPKEIVICFACFVNIGFKDMKDYCEISDYLKSVLSIENAIEEVSKQVEEGDTFSELGDVPIR